MVKPRCLYSLWGCSFIPANKKKCYCMLIVCQTVGVAMDRKREREQVRRKSEVDDEFPSRDAEFKVPEDSSSRTMEFRELETVRHAWEENRAGDNDLDPPHEEWTAAAMRFKVY